MAITTIIPVKHRYKHLIRYLRPKIDLMADDDELIVVDAACPENSGERINRQFQGDARIRSVCVPESSAGPFWDPGLFKNIGAAAAMNPHLLFLDADVNPMPGIERVLRRVRRGDPIDMVVAHERMLDPDYGEEVLPSSHEIDSQILISQNLFMQVNGFMEMPGWGGETIDLVRRVTMQVGTYDVDVFGSDAFRPESHDDEARCRYLPTGWIHSDTAFSTRDDVYHERMRQMRIARRRHLRAQPDRHFGCGVSGAIQCLERRGTVTRTLRFPED